MSRIIGIDLGTTNSAVAVYDNGEPLVVPNREGTRTTPSIVGITESGERLVGQQAKRQAVINPERTLSAVKRLMGRKFRSDEVQRILPMLSYNVVENVNGDAWIQVDGVFISPQEISAQILGSMRASAADYFSEEIIEAVVTVPAYFDDAQRQATIEAGRLAGLDVRRIVNEPTAAALAYGLSKGNCSVAVFDLGGGTFDVSILQLTGGVFEVVSTCGDNALGGEDFDHRIVKHLIDFFANETGIDVTDDKMALQRLKEAAESAKCELSTIAETNINLPFLAVGSSGPQHLNTQLTRSKLDDLVHDLVERLEDPCQTAFGDANMAYGEIDHVILVGGMTRMPRVREKVRELFRVDPRGSVNPDEIVATGAAIQSSILGGEVKEVVLLDVTPLSLGIAATGDRFSRVIEHNSAIPTRSGKVFTTTEDNQEFVQIKVFQGEDGRASANKLLGTFSLTGIPPARAGSPRIEVSFDIDTDGILHVSAQDTHTMRTQSVVITNGYGLSDEEFERAQARVKDE